MRIITLIFCLYFFAFGFLFSRETSEPSSGDFNGYVSGMPSLYWAGDTSMWQTLLHNRLNFNWFPSDKITATVQFRNNLTGGDFIKAQQFDDGFQTENYYLPLTYYQNIGGNYLLSLSADRLWLQFTRNNLEIKAGRQRINWGQTFVWNPNDIFNSYNFFEFDYPERPGADAIRVQYYTGMTSSIDLAAKLDSAGNISTAGLFRFNKWNYDFQLLAGLLNQSNNTIMADTIEWNDHDLALGLGFSGAVKNMSVRGEISYFHSLKEDSDSTNQIQTSFALDYTLSNSTYFMLEFLYNSNVLLPEGSGFLNFYGGSQNVKTLTYTQYNFFGQVSYPITPIFNATVSGMYYFDKNLLGYYIGPSLEYSLGDNLTLSTFFQFFAFRAENPFDSEKFWLYSNFAFLRLKWNF